MYYEELKKKEDNHIYSEKIIVRKERSDAVGMKAGYHVSALLAWLYAMKAVSSLAILLALEEIID
jgi:hypothetical protein